MFAYCSLLMVQTWLLLALLSPALYAIANVIDKFAVSKRVQNCFAYLTMVSAAWFLAAVVTFIFVSWSDVTINQIILGIFAGLTYSGGFYVYFYSMTFEEASRVVSIIFLSPLIVVGFAALLLGESLPVWKYAAILLTVAGAILIGTEKLDLKPVMRKGFWLLVLSCFFLATTNLINKYLIGSLSFWNMFGLQALGLSLGLAFSLLSKDARSHLRIAFKSWYFVFASEGLTFTGVLIFLYALTLTDISLVSPIGSVQPLYLLILTTLISSFKPQILKEVITKDTIFLKAIAVLMIVAGTFLVAM